MGGRAFVFTVLPYMWICPLHASLLHLDSSVCLCDLEELSHLSEIASLMCIGQYPLIS